MSTLTFEPVRFKGVPIRKYIPVIADWLATKGATALRGERASKLTKALWIFAALSVLAIATLYTFNPVWPLNIIPDAIPVVGMWDDYAVMMIAILPVVKLLKLTFGEDINFSKWERGLTKFGAIYSLCGFGAWDCLLPIVGSADEFIAMLLVFVPIIVFLTKELLGAIWRGVSKGLHPQYHGL